MVTQLLNQVLLVDLSVDPIMLTLVGAVLGVLVLGLLLKHFGIPSVVAYLLAGLVLGPQGLALFTDSGSASRLGSIGVVLLLFFVGMEVTPRSLLSNWKVAVLGTLAQIVVSVGCVFLIGLWLGWPVERSVLLGFVVSLSSTAVVLKILQDRGEMGTAVGQDVLSVLLMQDLAIIPMLIVIGVMSGTSAGATDILTQLLGGVLLGALLLFMVYREELHLPLGRLRDDHEMQVFAAFVACFGLALITGMMGLSTALGAFVGGIVVATARETQWVHTSLAPFRVVFVAMFFVSVGMLVDLDFLRDQWAGVLLLVIVALLTNTVINAVVLRLLSRSWRQSLYGGALLSQIGEFSFVLAAAGLQVGFITETGYQVTLSVIVLSLLASPVWIAAARRFTGVGAGAGQG